MGGVRGKKIIISDPMTGPTVRGMGEVIGVAVSVGVFVAVGVGVCGKFFRMTGRKEGVPAGTCGAASELSGKGTTSRAEIRINASATRGLRHGFMLRLLRIADVSCYNASSSKAQWVIGIRYVGRARLHC